MLLKCRYRAWFVTILLAADTPVAGNDSSHRIRSESVTLITVPNDNAKRIASRKHTPPEVAMFPPPHNSYHRLRCHGWRNIPISLSDPDWPLFCFISSLADDSPSPSMERRQGPHRSSRSHCYTGIDPPGGQVGHKLDFHILGTLGSCCMQRIGKMCVIVPIN